MLFLCKLAECEYATAERVAMVRGDNEIERHCQSAIGTHVQVELMNMWMLTSQRHINSGSKLLNTERRWRNKCEPARLLFQRQSWWIWGVTSKVTSAAASHHNCKPAGERNHIIHRSSISLKRILCFTAWPVRVRVGRESR